MKAPAKQIMTTAEAAAWLGIPAPELKRLMQAGHIRRLRGYRKPFKFSRIELERYLSAGVVA
jgi:excisionase family DNA binding protein